MLDASLNDVAPLLMALRISGIKSSSPSDNHNADLAPSVDEAGLPLGCTVIPVIQLFQLFSYSGYSSYSVT